VLMHLFGVCKAIRYLGIKINSISLCAGMAEPGQMRRV